MFNSLAVVSLSAALALGVDCSPSMCIDAVEGVEVEEVQNMELGERYETVVGDVSYEYYVNGDIVTLLPLEGVLDE